MALEDLDLTDRKILAELDKNARISYSELGKRTRIAKETVKYRINQLEKKGIIENYYTVFNFQKVGLMVYRLYLRLQNHTPEIEKRMLDYLAGENQVVVLYRTNGPYHLVVGLWAKDIWEFERIWLELNKKFCHHLAENHLSIMTEYSEFSRTYLLPEKNSRIWDKKVFVTMENEQKEDLDEFDLKLLELLSDNARASLVEIAKKMGVSVVTARQRLKNLIKKKVILGFRATLNLNALGKYYYKVDMWLNKFERKDEIERFVRSLPNCTYAERTIISGNAEFDLEVAGFEEFIQTMNRIREKFPEDIRDYKYYERISAIKVRYSTR